MNAQCKHCKLLSPAPLPRNPPNPRHPPPPRSPPPRTRTPPAAGQSRAEPTPCLHTPPAALPAHPRNLRNPRNHHQQHPPPRGGGEQGQIRAPCNAAKTSHPLQPLAFFSLPGGKPKTRPAHPILCYPHPCARPRNQHRVSWPATAHPPLHQPPPALACTRTHSTTNPCRLPLFSPLPPGRLPHPYPPRIAAKPPTSCSSYFLLSYPGVNRAAPAARTPCVTSAPPLRSPASVSW